MSKASADFSWDVNSKTTKFRASTKWIVGSLLTALGGLFVWGVTVAWTDRTSTQEKLNAATQVAGDTVVHLASIDAKVNQFHESQLHTEAKVDILLEVNGYDHETLQRRKP